jgi:hypothetical protein
MAGWGGPFAAITQFATSFLKGASESRQAQREQAEQQRARNITALEMLGRQVEQSSLIEPEKQAIQQDIMQRLVGEVASTKPVDKKNSNPLFNFVTQTARNLLGPGAPKVKPLGDEDLGNLYQRMLTGKTTQSVQEEALALWNQAANESKDPNGRILKDRLMNHDAARKGYELLTSAGVPMNEPMKVFLQTVGVSPQEAMMMGLYDEIGAGASPGGQPPAAPGQQGQTAQAPVAQGPTAQGPTPDAQGQSSSLMLAANQFSGGGAATDAGPGAGPLQALTQMATGPLPWHGQAPQANPQQGQPVAQGQPQAAAMPPAVASQTSQVSQVPQVSQTPQASPMQPGPQPTPQGRQFPMEADGDTALQGANQSLIGAAPLDARQRLRVGMLQKVFGAQTREYTLWNEKTGERIRVRDYGVVDPQGNRSMRVEAGTELPIQGTPEASGFVNIGNQRPPIQKAGIDPEEMAREVAATTAHVQSMAQGYPDLVKSYTERVRLASKSSSDPMGKLQQVAKDLESALDRRHAREQSRAIAAALREANAPKKDRDYLDKAISDERNRIRSSPAGRHFTALGGIVTGALTAAKGYSARGVHGPIDQLLVAAFGRSIDPQTGIRDAERKIMAESGGRLESIKAEMKAAEELLKHGGSGRVLSDATRNVMIRVMEDLRKDAMDLFAQEVRPSILHLEDQWGSRVSDRPFRADYILSGEMYEHYREKYGSGGGSPTPAGASSGAGRGDNPFASPSAAGGKSEPPKPGKGTPKLF